MTMYNQFCCGLQCNVSNYLFFCGSFSWNWI